MADLFTLPSFPKEPGPIRNCMSLLKNVKKLNERKKLGECLLELKLVSIDQLQSALEKAAKGNMLLGAYLVSEGIVSEEGMAKALGLQFSLPCIDLTLERPSPEALKAIPEGVIKQNKVLPLSVNGKNLRVAVYDPLSIVGISTSSQFSSWNLEIVVSAKSQLEDTIHRLFEGGSDSKMINLIASNIQKSEAKSGPPKLAKVVPLFEDTNADKRYSIEMLLNKLMLTALEKRASDIHFEPGKDTIRVRQRIDGILHDAQTLPMDLFPALLSRIKVLGGMDIAEKRLPQDGHIQMNLGNRMVDLRVSTLPLIGGEKSVIRILDRNSQKTDLTSLGMNSEQLASIKKLVGKPHGLVLVTGPTGSGKSTSVYSMIREINCQTRNVVTIEDPVEYQIDNINQVQVNTKAGVLFSNTLRSVLRQDPDVIMVGEIRDKETAEIAVRAALTGHLVISTLHTNSAAGTLSRLVEMGIEPFLLSSSLLGVVAQRLVRKLCPHCREESTITPEEKILLASPMIPDGAPVFRPKGCAKCNNIGYLGRVGIYELLVPDGHIRKMVNQGQVDEPIHAYLFEQHFHSLRLDGIDKAITGMTSIEEVLKNTL
jgi:type IV pilus assembly protein PilB